MNSSSSQEFLFRHFEKFIFGVLVCLALLLIYRGFQMPDFLQEQQPDRMEQSANQVKTSIDEDHWGNINSTESRLPTIDVVARTNESISPVKPQLYRLSHPWEGKSMDTSIKRSDPEIAAPIEVIVRGVVASIAVKTGDAEYPLAALENVEPIAKAPEPPKPPKRRTRPSMEEMMMGSAAEMMMPDSAAMPGMEMMGSATEMSGMSMAGMKPGRQINALKYDQGFRPSGTTMNLAPAMGHFIAGVALMPHKQLHKSFEQAFEAADGWDPRRDQPLYIGFQMQRADVTDKPVDQLVEKDWVNRGASKYFQQLLLKQWAGMAKEIVAGKYRDPELTSAIPPVLLQHYADFVSHPRIPLGDEDLTKTNNATRSAAPVGPIVPSADDDPFANTNNLNVTRPGGPMMGSGMMGSGMMGSGMMNEGYSMGGSGYAMMGVQAIVEQPEHKLIRFYDFRDFSGQDPAAPQPGRKYVYRVRVAIEDPNFPRDPVAQPRNSTLSAEVFRRVEQENAKAASTKRRNFIRWSEFSAPSAVVSLPPIAATYAGPVVPTVFRKMQLDGKDVEVAQKPPTGKLVVTQWNREYQVPVPVFMDVVRGTVVAKKGDLEVPDPLSQMVKKLPNADINTEMVVLDLEGGQPLAISTGETQTEPSLILLFSADGGLQVSDEVTTQHGYRLYSFADDRGE